MAEQTWRLRSVYRVIFVMTVIILIHVISAIVMIVSSKGAGRCSFFGVCLFVCLLRWPVGSDAPGTFGPGQIGKEARQIGRMASDCGLLS